MTDQRLPVTVRRMMMEDIDQVLELDRLAFPTPWSARTYRYEITNGDRSVMLVVEPTETTREAGQTGKVLNWFKQQLAQSFPPPAANRALLAYAGMWQIAGEAHISTIAVHPDWRGKKLGELLVWVLVREAIRREAEMVTLEVRISNAIAQNLYRKYGFEITGQRKGYYRDNGEDAYLMTIPTLGEPYHRKMAALGHALSHYLIVTTRGLTLPQNDQV
jgi:ribosomal-protein-alanine N-acetyltransferase